MLAVQRLHRFGRRVLHDPQPQLASLGLGFRVGNFRVGAFRVENFRVGAFRVENFRVGAFRVEGLIGL